MDEERLKEIMAHGTDAKVAPKHAPVTENGACVTARKDGGKRKEAVPALEERMKEYRNCFLSGKNSVCTANRPISVMRRIAGLPGYFPC